MAGIPVHTASPISSNSPKTTAAKPDTSTAAPIAVSGGPASNTATTTAAPISNYPAAQPGAAPVPAPTSTAPHPTATAPTRTIPPPGTSTGISDSPAPPQPGQAPSPYVPSPHSRNPAIPPPPQASSLPYPNPTQNLAATTTAVPTLPPMQNAYQQPQPASVSGYATDLSHPPGYSQNVSGSFQDRDRAGGETTNTNTNTNLSYYHSSCTPFYSNMTYSPRSNHSYTGSSPSRRDGSGGILDNNPSRYAGARDHDNFGEEESMWNTAAKWAKAAGQKLSEGEQQIWKMVNNEK